MAVSMTDIPGKLARFLSAEDGPTAVEYAIALMFIFLACLSAVIFLGQSTASSFESSQSSIEQTMQSGP